MSEEITAGQREAQKGETDLLFLIDISGSMAPCIESIVKNLSDFDECIKKGGSPNNPTPDVINLRYKVAYFSDIDHDPAEYAMNFDNQWTSDVNEVRSQLETLIPLVKEKQLGDDEPESLFEAINKIATEEIFTEKVDARTRAVLIFTDATSKPVKDHDGLEPDEQAELLAQVCKEAHLKIFLVAPGWEGYSLFTEQFDEIPNKVGSGLVEYLAKGEPYVDGAKDWNELANMEISEFKNLMDVLAKDVSQYSL